MSHTKRLLAFLGFVMLPFSAVAELEEIVVTAEKRESTIQDTPLSISAFDDEMRDDLGIAGAADIANYTPGMTYNASPNRIFIRGIGRVDNSLGSEPGVAIYRDGIYTNEAASVSDNTFFAERIEVLRGPQGTLYGRNAIGGAANVHSKRPSEKFDVQVRLGAYNYGGTVMSAHVSGPLADAFRYKLAYEVQKNDGWVDNIAGDDQNQNDFSRSELQIEWDITEKLSVWMAYQDYHWDDENPGGTVMISPYNTTSPGAPIGDFNTDFQQLVPNPQLGGTTPNPNVDDLWEVNYDDSGYHNTEGDRLTVHITYDWEQWQLKYVYGYNDYEFDYEKDYDRTANPDIRYLNYIGQYEDYEQHELQLISNLGGNVEFIFGLFNWQSDNFQPFTLYSPTNPVLQTPVWVDPVFAVCGCVVDAPPNPQGIFYHQAGQLDTDSSAAYAQMDYYFNDKWHMALGVRYSDDEKEGYEEQRIIFDGQGTYAFIFNFLLPLQWFNVNTPTPGPQARIAWDFSNGLVTATHEDEWSSTDWSLGLDYRPDDTTMYYGKVSSGYKAGGFRLGSLQANQGVDEESVIAYELGYKKAWENLELNAAAYYYDYEDMQVPVNAIINGVDNLLFQNAEEASQWGFEVDMRWAATDNLTVYSTYTHMDTEIDSMGFDVVDTTEFAPVASDLSGNELIKSPEHKFTLNLDYRWSMFEGEMIFVTSYVYTDEQYSSIFNRESTQVPDFERTDFRLTYRANDRDLRISAYVRNAFDEEIIESMTRSSWYFNQQLSASIQPPRTYGIEVQFGIGGN
ncbi:MAG: TonB-dependent receptor [Pseudomonadales bacterium]|nr:TonB-dependent receptor [Pseudomonadales bacterium]MBO7006989.1 TonB-dependent receptor [Pseudomonadales bacterium]